jgi:hypothetical protein
LEQAIASVEQPHSELTEAIQSISVTSNTNAFKINFTEELRKKKRKKKEAALAIADT